MQNGIPERTVIRAALISEGILLLLSVIWAMIRGISLPIEFDALAIYRGVRATGPLIAFNFGVFGILANLRTRYSVYRDFRDKVVYPICKNLTLGAAVILAVCSGFAEELMFRGILQSEFNNLVPLVWASILTSLLFAYVHFIGIFRKYFAVFLIYFLFGLYFAYLSVWGANLVVPMMAHALYNFLAIIMIKHFSAAVPPK